MSKQPHNPQPQAQQKGQSRQAGGQSEARQQHQFDAGESGHIASQIRARMEVVGADGARVGQVERVDGDRLRLAGQDWQGSDISNRSLPIDRIQSVEGDRVRLTLNAAQAVSQASRG